MNLNKAIIVGRITDTPEKRVTKGGSPVTSFSIATNSFYKDKNGESQSEVEYHNVVFFGKQAEDIHKYMDKGSLILVEGKLKTNSWEDDKGIKRYRTNVVGYNCQFGPSPENRQEKMDIDVDEEDIPVVEENDLNPEDIPF